MSWIPQPSLHWWPGRSERRFDGNWKGLLCPCAPPSVVLRITLVPVFHSSVEAWPGLNQMHTYRCFVLAQNTFIRKLMSRNRVSVLVMATAIRSISSLSLILFQISWGRNSISAANFNLFSLGKFSKLVDYTRKYVWTFTPALPTYTYNRHTIETHTYVYTLDCQDDVCFWNA